MGSRAALQVLKIRVVRPNMRMEARPNHKVYVSQSQVWRTENPKPETEFEEDDDLCRCSGEWRQRSVWRRIVP